MTIEIHIARNSESSEWDSEVSRSVHGTLFHHWEWLKIAERHTRTKLYPLVGTSKGEVVGLFPLFFQKKGPARMVFSPPPHAAMFYLGPAFSGFDTIRQERREERYSAFLNATDSFIAGDLQANYVNISLSPVLQDPRPFSWAGYRVDPAFDYVSDLTRGADYLFQSLDKKQRQDINRAKKRGISVELGGSKEVDVLLDLMNERYGEQAKIVTIPPAYLRDIYHQFRENITVFTAIAEGEIVTGLIDLNYRNSLYSWIGNPKPRKAVSPSPNDLMAWEVIRYGCEQKFRSHVTMGAAGNQRLHTYYASKFEPELLIRYRAKKTSFASGVFEKGYTHILKPLRGKIKHMMTG